MYLGQVLVTVASELAIDIVQHGLCSGESVLSIPHLFGHILRQHVDEHHIQRFIRNAGAMFVPEMLPFSDVRPQPVLGWAQGERRGSA